MDQSIINTIKSEICADSYDIPKESPENEIIIVYKLSDSQKEFTTSELEKLTDHYPEIDYFESFPGEIYAHWVLPNTITNTHNVRVINGQNNTVNFN